MYTVINAVFRENLNMRFLGTDSLVSCREMSVLAGAGSSIKINRYASYVFLIRINVQDNDCKTIVSCTESS